jgi:GDP/UDP-N,N'-diacetylbacillosamine 2-epimerase (hydrolysing)
MHHCLFVAGNSSSGIIEAASLSKFSLNIGDRQKNRLCDPSVVHARVNMKDIKNGIDNINQSLASKNSNFKKSIYGDGSAPEIFIDFLTNYDLTFNPKVFEDIK